MKRFILALMCVALHFSTLNCRSRIWLQRCPGDTVFATVIPPVYRHSSVLHSEILVDVPLIVWLIAKRGPAGLTPAMLRASRLASVVSSCTTDNFGSPPTSPYRYLRSRRCLQLVKTSPQSICHFSLPVGSFLPLVSALSPRRSRHWRSYPRPDSACLASFSGTILACRTGSTRTTDSDLAL